MYSRIAALLILSISTTASNATIIITDDYVKQQVEYTVLGNTYTTAYSGGVYGVDTYIKQEIGLDFSHGSFIGVSTGTSNTAAGLISFAQSRFSNIYAGAYELEVHSIRYYEYEYSIDWSSWPEVYEAYCCSEQNSYLKFSTDFRVVGEGDHLILDGWVEHNEWGSFEFCLIDHTAGVSYCEQIPDQYNTDQVFVEYALQDGHAYTAKAHLFNSSPSEHTVASEIYFISDEVVVPTPSIPVLWITGLIALVSASRVQRRSRSRMKHSD